MRFVLLSGLGADQRLLEPQQRDLADVVAPQWIEPHRDESLTAYGARFAKTIGVTNDPIVLGGVSFGGIVATELVRYFPNARLALIASCTTPAAFAGLIRIARPLARFAPASLVKSRLGASLVEGRFGLETLDQRLLFRAMLRDASADFIRWALRAISRWEGADFGTKRVHRIGGSADRIIRPFDCDVVVDGAGHFLNVTHSSEVNAFLSSIADGQWS